MLALSVVVITAAVGIACLVLASSAMAMPAPQGSSGCELPGSSVVACPHENPLPGSPTGSERSVPKQAAGTEAMPQPAGALSAIATAGDLSEPPQPPVACPLPLRL